MSLEITGKVIEILEEKSGEGKNGTWRKQEFILETPGQYPKSVCVMVWGDNIDKFGVQDGETLTAQIDVQSREFNGKWYTDVKAWRIDRKDGAESGPPADAGEPWPEPSGSDSDDELPF
jgi:Domain of unknown function (DUF3127)